MSMYLLLRRPYVPKKISICDILDIWLPIDWLVHSTVTNATFCQKSLFDIFTQLNLTWLIVNAIIIVKWRHLGATAGQARSSRPCTGACGVQKWHYSVRNPKLPLEAASGQELCAGSFMKRVRRAEQPGITRSDARFGLEWCKVVPSLDSGALEMCSLFTRRQSEESEENAAGTPRTDSRVRWRKNDSFRLNFSGFKQKPLESVEGDFNAASHRHFRNYSMQQLDKDLTFFLFQPDCASVQKARSLKIWFDETGEEKLQ